MTDRPSGTVTFLFTDIVGSTKHWDQHPAAMRDALARHDVLLREAIAAHRGVVFKALGDAFYSVFTTALDALSAALTAQRALRAAAWPDPPGRLRVRMALHSGATEERDGDYFGPPLNRLARILPAGHGGQILLSGAAQELVVDHLPTGVHLRDLGVQPLKDLTRPEHLFQVVVADLPADFPPLITLTSRANNLPTQPTALIGREHDVAAALTLLRRPEVRLVTFTGVGGTGKTRLALQVAADLLDAYSDGVFFVSLAPIRDPDLVVPTIATALDIREEAGRPLDQTVKDYLRGRQILLVLDNFEQVVAAAPAVTSLLTAASRLRVLVTSRALLRAYGEHEFPVPPLALPEAGRLPAQEALSQYAAVALFIQRAQAAKLDFQITNETAPAVAEICAQLDGLPLAIELAAARSKLYSPPALLGQLRRRLAVLVGGARDLPARQQTLRGAIDWSYDLLDADARRLFARLGVFVGGCTTAAATTVVFDRDAADPIGELSALADQSLLRQVVGADGEPRFLMLETLREYALDRLDAAGESAIVRQRHAEYFLSQAQAAANAITLNQPGTWYRRLDEDHDNMRAALTWLLDQQASEQALDLVGSLWPFWDHQGHMAEGRRWIDRALAGYQGPVTPALYAATYGSAVLTCRQGNGPGAYTLFDTARRFAEELGDQPGVAWSVHGLAWAAVLQSDYAATERYGTASLALFRTLDHKRGQALAQRRLGNVAHFQGDCALAQRYYEASLALSREVGDTGGVSASLSNLGEVARGQGAYEEAARFYEEAIRVMRADGEKAQLLIVLHNLGHTALHLHAVDRAAALFAEGLTAARDFGHQPVIGLCLVGLAGCAAARGQGARAARLFGAGTALLRALDRRLEVVDQEEYDHHLAAARATLDPAAWDAAWNAGAALPLDQAISEALALAE